MKTRLDEIRERAGKATEGPWLWGDWSEDDGPNKSVLHFMRPMDEDEKKFWARPGARYENGLWPERIVGCQECAGENTNIENDRAFIAHSRSDIPYLLSRIEALEGVREALEKVIARKPYTDDESGWEGAARDIYDIAEAALAAAGEGEK